MSLRELTLNICDGCHMDMNPYHLIKRGDIPESENIKCFAWGYSCMWCGHRWEAREQDKLDHPDEFIDRE